MEKHNIHFIMLFYGEIPKIFLITVNGKSDIINMYVYIRLGII